MAILAPLVHGRTLNLDFRSRFIASPSDFDESAVEWARRYILAMTAVSYKLEDADLWWSVFSNERHVVSGVLCRAKRISKDCLTDGSRQLYVYLGVVAKQPAQFVPEMAIEHFAPLYEYVRVRWNESADADLGAPHLIDYREFNIPESFTREGGIELNRIPNTLTLWPLADRLTIWSLAHKTSTPAIIGAPLVVGIKNGLYPNVCSPDVLAKRVEPMMIQRDRREANQSVSKIRFFARKKTFSGTRIEVQSVSMEGKASEQAGNEDVVRGTRESMINRVVRWVAGRFKHSSSKSLQYRSSGEQRSSKVERLFKKTDER